MKLPFMHSAVIALLALLLLLALVLVACGPNRYILTTSVYPSGAGTVSPDSGTYDEGTEVTLTAVAASGYRFDHWSGDATSTSTSVTLTMDKDKNVVAHFRVQYSVGISVDPRDAGTVSPGNGTYDEGSQLTLTADAATGYRFDHWGGDASGVSDSITLTINGDKSIIAHFTRQYLLTVSASPNTAGTIIPTGGVFDKGANISLVASIAPGYLFRNWSGDASGTTSEITIAMDRDKSIIANFDQLPDKLLYCERSDDTNEQYERYTVNIINLGTMATRELLGFAIQVNPGSGYPFPYFDPTIAVSPDETKLAYFASPLSEQNTAILYVYNIATGQTLKLAEHPVPEWYYDLYLAWAPDSRSIAFVGNRDLYVVNADGSGLKRLYEHKYANYGWYGFLGGGKKEDQVRRIAWTSDGARILFDDFNTPYSIHSGGLDVLDCRTFKSIEPIPGDLRELLSPARLLCSIDDSKILVQTIVDGQEKTFIMNDNGINMGEFQSEAYFVKHSQGFITWFNGKAIAGSGDFVPNSVHIIDLEGNLIATLNNVLFYSTLDWSPDGRYIAYMFCNSNTNTSSVSVREYNSLRETSFGKTYECQSTWETDPPIKWLAWIK